MRSLWVHLALAGGMILIATVVAKVVDMRIDRHDLAPRAATRYSVLRRTIVAVIVFVGVLSALLVIPEVRAIAGGILASSAVLGIVIGLAAQRTLGNFIAGLSIAFTEPVRLGDQIEVGETEGVVEEIGLTYTWVRTPEGNMFVIPNEKLASETILNKTIRKQK
jgi:small conductance mechanosensitive channel